MSTKALDLTDMGRLTDAVAIAHSQFGPAAVAVTAMKLAALKNLVQQVNSLSITASTIPIIKQESHLNLDLQARKVVRKMQIIIEEEPEDIKAQLSKWAVILHRHLTGRQEKDPGTMWVPQCWVDERKIAFFVSLHVHELIEFA
jgi:hypothetical protein